MGGGLLGIGTDPITGNHFFYYQLPVDYKDNTWGVKNLSGPTTNQVGGYGPAGGNQHSVEKIWDGDPEWQARLGPISEQLASSDAFVIIAPEWHGMVPSGLKNFFLMWGKGELAHKPALIAAVSSGDGGAYPVAELRMSSYKNNRICYIPEQLILRNVESVLNDEGDNDAEADPYFRERTLFALRILHQYALALEPVRASGLTFDARFKNGL